MQHKIGLILVTICALLSGAIVFTMTPIHTHEPEQEAEQPVEGTEEAVETKYDQVPEKPEEKTEPAKEQPKADPKPAQKPAPKPAPKAEAPKQEAKPNTSNFKSQGVINYGGKRYTWYSSKVLRHYRTNEWTPDAQGIYRDAEGYAVVASSEMKQGTVIADTPFGAAKVYDSGCAAGTIDVYVNF